MHKLLLVAVVLAACAACSSSSGSGLTGPSDNGSLTGTWRGTTSSNVSGMSGTVLAALRQNGSQIDGNIRITSALGVNDTITVGTFIGTTLTLTIPASEPGGCQTIVTATRTDSTTLRGSYSDAPCVGADNGPFVITKQ